MGKHIDAVKRETVHLSGFAGRLRQLRGERGLSQDALGRLCGFKSPQERIKNYEQGRRNPSLADAQILAKVLGASTSDLYFGGAEVSLPIIGWGNMSKPCPRTAHRRLTIFWPLDISERAFVVTIPDDSMAPFAVKGELWIIDPDAPPRHGDTVVLEKNATHVVALAEKLGRRLIFKDLTGAFLPVSQKGGATRFVGVRKSRVLID